MDLFDITFTVCVVLAIAGVIYISNWCDDNPDHPAAEGIGFVWDVVVTIATFILALVLLKHFSDGDEK